MNKRGRVGVFAASCVLALVLGFFAVPAETGRQFVKFGGWWLMAATFVVFIWAVIKVIARSPLEWRRDRREWAALLVVPAGCVLLLVHEPRTFKIIMDEIMLLGTSMSLHFDRLVQVPMRGHDIEGAFVIVDGLIDKRPYFFPFLLSLVHGVSGYRPENAFVLNALLAFALLVVVYVLGRMLAGRLAAVAGVVLLSGLPLLGQSATGGGFDLLNVLMIAVTLLLAARFVQTSGEWELTAFCFSAVLLAQTRYESAFYIVPCVLAILWVWRQQRRVILPWPVMLTPLLLLPVPWLLNVFQPQSASWEMASQPGSGSPLSLSYGAANLRHAWAFFFDPTGAQPNSLVFSALGWIAIAALIVLGARWAFARDRNANPTALTAAVFAVALLAHFALLMAYFWGKLDDPVIARLSLPTHLLFLIALWLAVPAGLMGARIWIATTGLALMQLWSLSVPAMAAHAYTLQNVHAQEVEWRRAFLMQRPEKDFLFVDPYSVVWLTHQVSSTSPAQARTRPEAIAHHLRAHSFKDVLVFQRFEVDPDTGKQTVRAEFDLGSGFVLEPVMERRLQPYTVSRISRVTAVNP